MRKKGKSKNPAAKLFQYKFISMKRSFCALLIFGLLFLSGCAVGPNFTKPEVEVPQAFMYDSIRVDTTELLSWWELFDDEVLDTLIMEALRNNKNVRMAASRVQQAWAALGFYRADLFPKLDVAASAYRGNFFGQKTQLTNNFYGVAQLSWELDFWGKYRRATEAAKAELLASEYGMKAVQVSLITTVAATYFQMLDFDHRLEVSKQTLAARDSSLMIIRARFDRGIIPELDVNQAEIQKAVSEAAVPFYERQRSQTENALKVLLGENPGVVERGAGILEQALPPQIPAGLPSLLLERRPDIRETMERYHAQLARVGVAEAQRLPSISLTGILGAASTDLSTITSSGLAWSIGGDLLGPLFHFNKNKRRAQVERFLAEEYLLAYEQTVLDAFREVEDALIEISTLKQELEARKLQSTAAQNAEYLSQQRYDRGVTSYLEVLETQRASFESQQVYSQTYQQLLGSYVKLYKALGGGWITPQEKLEAEQE